MRLLFILIGFVALLTSSAQAQDRISAAASDRQDTPVGQGLQAFSDTLQSCTNGSIDVDVFTDGVLGSPIDIAIALQSGSVDIAILPASALQQFSSAVSILSAPLVFNNRRHWETALDGPVVEALDSDLNDAAGLRVLGFMGGEQYGILSTSPITTPEDIEGRNIRTAGIDVSTFEALGANPVPMAFAEVFSALQTGAIDATETTADVVVRTKAYEAAPEFTTTNHRIFTDLIVMSRLSFENLSDDVRICLSEAVETASKVGRDAVVSLEQAALAELTEIGIEVRRIENRPTLFEQASGVTSELVDELGANEVYELILSSVTCPTWCVNSTCDDDECKACKVCE